MTTLPAVSVLIPADWTPEQALAVLELLNGLRDAIWAIHGDRCGSAAFLRISQL